MEKQIFSAKTQDEAKEEALKKLNLTEQDVIFIEIEEKKSLFSKKCEISVITKADFVKFIKNFITKIINMIGLECNIEFKVRDDTLYFNIITNNSPLLIGKNGKNIDALQAIINQMIFNEIGSFIRTQIDVSDYKIKRQSRIEKMAKYTAKDVAMSNCCIKLEPMNSYERRIVHNILANSKDVTTISEGEEPNRYVIIKPKDDK